MKKYIYQLLCSLFIGGTMVACTEDYMETDKGHDTLTLSVNQQELVLNEKNHSQEALALSWTTGTNYGSGNRISYTLELAKADAVVAEMGSLEGSNHRNINKMLVNQVLPTCQLQMGMTELAPGSVWNTMPAHVHSRRMEAYFYFEIPEDHAICHFMGEVGETRHVWMKGDQAVLSPEWSIHSAAATHNYTFIWGMGGENLDYGDQDFSLITDLK